LPRPSRIGVDQNVHGFGRLTKRIKCNGVNVSEYGLKTNPSNAEPLRYPKRDEALFRVRFFHLSLGPADVKSQHN